MLRNKHPIINDEHVSVFSIETLEKILIKHKYKIVETKSLKNYYTFRYWFKMFPFPDYVKKLVMIIFNIFNISTLNIGIKAGNIYCIAQKPD